MRNRMVPQTVRRTAYALLRTKRIAPVLVRVLARHLPILRAPTSPDIGLLVLDPERWWTEDLDELGMRARLVAFPSIVRQRLLQCHLIDEDFRALRRYDFTAAGLVRKNAAITWLRSFLPALAAQVGCHAIVTTNHMYAQNKVIAAACQGSSLPFIDIHKESMKDDGDMHTLFRAKCAGYNLHLPFLGHRICVYNAMMRDLFVAMGIAPANRIAVVGALRMDRFRRRVERERHQIPLDTVTLFSFRHVPPGGRTEDYVQQFSPDGSRGYAQLFDTVHGAFAQLALAHPHIRFVVKMKWHDVWQSYVHRAVARAGVDITDIPNLHLVADEEHAQDLVMRSFVVIGFNSTALFEARIAGRPVILPQFAELAGIHRNTLAFRAALHEFTVVTSAAALNDAVRRYIHEPLPYRPMHAATYTRYFGAGDGHALDRVLTVICDAVRTATPHAISSR